MRLEWNKTWVALVGAVVLPLAALLYLAGLPDGGRNSLLAILLQVAIVIGSVVLFAIFLARVVEQDECSAGSPLAGVGRGGSVAQDDGRAGTSRVLGSTRRQGIDSAFIGRDQRRIIG